MSPSLLSADFLYLVDEIMVTNESQCDWLYIDVMDGALVPNLSFGFPIIEAICSICQKPLDMHLMIVEPRKSTDQFAKLGIHIVNVHYEVYPHPHRTLRIAREVGMCPIVTPDPRTLVEFLTGILCEADMVFLTSVDPGYSGQELIEHSIRKVERLRKVIQEQGLFTLIQVDGEVSLETGHQLAEVDADSLVAGSAAFRAPSP